ncbi:MAG: hypothetical protein QME66_04785 [Candidatus Eisenbacteria bacterium]|nr:hypothetical protein [Candidatus Eisenbacteria bacterium]
MKAKEYAEEYKKDPSPDRLKKILGEFLVEVKTIAQQRQVKRTGAFVSVLNEVSDKYRAFAVSAGDGIRPDGFERALVVSISPKW